MTPLLSVATAAIARWFDRTGFDPIVVPPAEFDIIWGWTPTSGWHLFALCRAVGWGQ